LSFARVDFLLKLNLSFDDVFVGPNRGGENTDEPTCVLPVYLEDVASYVIMSWGDWLAAGAGVRSA
jgi:hypothetical protein